MKIDPNELSKLRSTTNSIVIRSKPAVSNGTNGNSPPAKLKYAEFIREKCFDCIPHEPTEPGTHLEQVAYCTTRSCPLFSIRPTPRKTRSGGKVDEAKVAPIIEKMDRINAKRRADDS